MSFMYNPFPYDDPTAVNRIEVEPRIKKAVVRGLGAVAAELAAAAKAVVDDRGYCVLALDGYIGAAFEIVALQVARAAMQRGVEVRLVAASTLYADEAVLAERLGPYLPEDREMDPPLLYGRVFHGGYEGIMEASRVDSLALELRDHKASRRGLMILHGPGCLARALRPLSDLRAYLDVTPKRAVLAIKHGRAGNLGFASPKPFNPTLRQAYYVDFEVAGELRGEVIRNRELDYYVAADDADDPRLLPFDSFLELCRSLAGYPFRCRPVYLEGVWGGYYVKRLRSLPESMRNCAWVFDLIPLEVSIVADLGGVQVEMPYYSFVQTVGEELMGRDCVEKFKGYFPIRFNYDDTFHASGNMSIQCHPDGAYVREQNGELGRQDESYYIVVAGQEAKTYCGFQQDADVEEFIGRCKASERDGEAIDHDRYVRSEPSRPGMQFLIPAGTIHASGRNQVILEIGSLTVGSYTYKMYDYVRKDLEGKLRPIHTRHGDAVLRRERRGDWVKANLIQEPRVLREEEGGVETVVGEHELLYFSLRNLRFAHRMTDDTAGRFHVLVLVEGEKVLVRSLSDPSKRFEQRYLDVVVVPASFGAYEVVNQGVGVVTLHKTLLRDGYESIEL